MARHFAAYVATPLIIQDAPYGMLVVYYRTQRQIISQDIRLAMSVAHQAALAIESARLRERAEQTAVVTERSRLSRELHDSVTQSLYSVMLFAEASVRSLANQETAEASDYLKELRDTAQEALREMRLLIFELRPPALEKHGLVAALQTRLNAVEGRGGMKTALNVSDDRRAEQLPVVMQEELYQIVREALNNVIRHAHAQRVEVGIAFAEQEIQLKVTDDGIGFVPVSADESSGLGLRGMRERVQRIGGTLEISSGNGKGTRVTVQVPYAQTADATSTGGDR
jgi:signal transduction histidine kinase